MLGQPSSPSVGVGMGASTTSTISSSGSASALGSASGFGSGPSYAFHSLPFSPPPPAAILGGEGGGEAGRASLPQPNIEAQVGIEEVGPHHRRPNKKRVRFNEAV